MQPIQGSQRQLPPHPTIFNQQYNQFIPRYSSQKNIKRQSFSSQSFESNMPLQSSASRHSFERMSTQSLQSMDSSEAALPQQQSQPILPNQTFEVIYNRRTFMVDPNQLMDASLKFKELIQPFIIKDEINPDAQLEVIGSDFSYRNIDNFLKLCQNLPTDVQNSEMKDICEIAKMFQAEKIYDVGISFIHKYIDPNFNIQDDKYDESNGKRNLIIKCENHIIHHVVFSDIDFEGFNENADEDTKDNNINEKPKSILINQNSNEKIESNCSCKENLKKGKTIIYNVFIENHSIKCPVYRFCSEKTVLYTAKQKNNNIYIGSGSKVHINRDTSNHVGHIYQDNNKTNFILADKDKYEVKYVSSGRPNHLSLSVTFPYKSRQITWDPKKPKYDETKNKYYLNFHGEFHRNPIKSGKNIVLANSNGHTAFIVRKMTEDMFELEALPSINPLIIFTIGLSDIVGPYEDQFGGI